jgi:serine/threonine protein kinase
MISQYPSKNDILTAMKNQVCYRSHELIGGSIIQTGSRVIFYTGGYASVFPFTKSNGTKIGVRCWFSDIGNPKKRMLSISKYLTQLNCPYFVKFNYHEDALIINGVLHPIVTMDWIEYPTLKEFLNENITNRSAILIVAENFKKMVRYFHKNIIAHGDLSHGNIKVKEDGSLFVIDYDSMFVQELDGMSDIVKGLPGYQHPCRYKNQKVSLKLDYFSELVIYLAFLVFAEYPELWNSYYETEDLLFSRQDYESPEVSSLLNKLLDSNNPQIAELTRKLVECLHYNDILDLKPLEELFNSKIDELAIDIINKF